MIICTVMIGTELLEFGIIINTNKKHSQLIASVFCLTIHYYVLIKMKRYTFSNPVINARYLSNSILY